MLNLLNPTKVQYTMLQANEISLRREQHGLDIYLLQCNPGEIVMESMATDFGFLPLADPDPLAATAWWKTVRIDPDDADYVLMPQLVGGNVHDDRN
jgi:hypothetical protein